MADQVSHVAIPATTSSQQKWTLASTCAGFALENMDVMFLSFALSSMIASLHLTTGQAGLISTVTNLGMLVGGTIFGLVADKFGRVKTFSWTIFIFAIATAAMSLSSTIGHVYFWRFIAGIGAGGEYGVGITLIAERFPLNQIGKMTSLAAIGGQLGAVLAAILAAMILPAAGWHALFLIGVVPVLLTFFIRRHVTETPAFETTTHSHVQRAAFQALFATPRLTWQTLALMLMTVVQIAGYFGLMNWLPTIMQQQLHLTVSGSSLWMIATIGGMSLGMLTFGQLLDRMGPRLAFGLFLIGAATSVFAINFAKSLPAMLVAGAVLGFFSNGMFGGYGAVISRLYPTEVRSTANNVIVNVGRAIGGFSSLVIGILMEHFSLLTVMACISGIYLLSLLVMLTIPALRHFQTTVITD